MFAASAPRASIRELAGGASSIAFSYRIVGRRKDVRHHRRFAKIDTRLSLPAVASRAHAPKGARKVGRSRPPKRWSRRAADSTAAPRVAKNARRRHDLIGRYGALLPLFRVVGVPCIAALPSVESLPRHRGDRPKLSWCHER